MPIPSLSVLTALFLVVCLCLPAAQAAVVENLYRVDLQAADDSNAEQLQREAAEVMLRRLAGAQLDLAAPAIQQALRDPRQLMRRVGTVDEQGHMRVEFEPALLRELLASAQLPLLGRNRPGVLLWAVVGESLGDQLLSADSEWADALRRAAAHRGVALLLPLGDLEDRVALSEADIREQNRSVLLAASERYAADALLAVSLDSRSDDWQLDWQFWLDDTGAEKTREQGARDQLADRMMLELADLVHRRYAVVPASRDADSGSAWRIVVQGVNSVQAYAGLQRSLNQLGTQSSLQLLEIVADQLVLSLEFAGERDQLLRLLRLDQRLTLSAPPLVEAGQTQIDRRLPADGELPTRAELAEQRRQLELTRAAARERERTLYFDWR